MGSLKSPGPDGYQAVFFQKNWRVIGNDVCELIQDIFQCPENVKEIN